MRQSLQASFLVLLLAGAPALAEPATSEGAKALAESFATYFGQSALDKGIINVAPQGEDYKVTVDLQKLVDGQGLPPGDSVQIGAVSFLTSPQQGGAWKVAMSSFPSVSAHLSSPDGDVAGSFAVNGYKFDGVYDPKLASFLAAKGSADLVDVKWTAKGTDVALQEAGFAFDVQSSDAGGGAVSVKARNTIKSVSETVKVTSPAKQGAPAQPVSIVYKLGPLSGDATLEAMHSRGLLDLWAFLVAQQGVEHVVEHQDELKSRLKAILPLWNSAKVDASISDVSAGLPFGEVGLKSFGERIGFSGLASHGEFELGFKLDGPTFPAALLPSWSKPLLPSSLDADFKMTAEGLDQIARALIDDLDLKATPPLSEASQGKLAAMWLGGHPRLVIGPGRLTSPSYAISVQGELEMTKPKPSGRLTIEADGLDKTFATIQEAAKTTPMLQQALAGLTFVKGLAKPAADGKPSWVIELGADGAVSVNGMKFGK